MNAEEFEKLKRRNNSLARSLLYLDTIQLI